MHLIQTSALKPGDKLGRPVYTESGQVLVNADVELTASMIKRLQELGVQTVYVSDPLTDDIVVPELVSDKTRQRAVKTVHQTFSRMIEARKWNRTFSLGQAGIEFRKMFEDILYELQDNKELILHLSSIYASSNYLFSHSVNVGIYATVIGMVRGLNRNRLIELGVGAMLHDIGKTQIPQEIIEKPGKLTEAEFEEMKKHTTYGYEILRQQPEIPLLSAHCALQHHERMDGSGYPRGLERDDIHLFGRIVGLVDTYDALISNRPYRKAYLPHEAFEIILASVDKYDPDLLIAFRDHVALYPVGMIVSLNTGETGVVVDVNSKHLHRPIVRVFKNPAGESVAPYEIDLSSRLSIMITGCKAHL